MKERIEQKLKLVLNPDLLELRDVSDQHRGHRGWKESGESHFELKISSPDLRAVSLLRRHQLIHQILEKEIKEIHALSIVVVL